MRRSRPILLVIPFAALLALILFAPSQAYRVSYSALSAAAWPFLKIGFFAKTKTRDFFGFFKDQGQLRHQVGELQGQVQRLSEDQLRLSELQAENDRLKKLLDFKQAKHRKGVAARVMGYDPSGWVQSIIIDKGAAHGIAVNQAVLCDQGVVGRIAKTGAYSSQVLLVVDKHIRVGAYLEKTREAGVLEGLAPRRCRVLYLPAGTPIDLGQRVLTSGLGGIFPKGFLLGKVVGVGYDDLQLYQYVDIDPAVSFSKLEEVLVLGEAEA